jgi:hypothetical protein
VPYPHPDRAGREVPNLGKRLAGVGRREEEVAATAEAVDIYQRLAENATPAIPHTECRTALGNRTWDDRRSGMSATSRARSAEPRAGPVKASGCPPVLVNQTAQDVDAFNPISKLVAALIRDLVDPDAVEVIQAGVVDVVHHNPGDAGEALLQHAGVKSRDSTAAPWWRHAGCPVRLGRRVRHLRVPEVTDRLPLAVEHI